MALQIRRGTDSQRQGITPAEGELIYTTDTDKLYIGDGSTQGGIEVSGGTDSAAVQGIISAASIDAAQLDGQNPSYYLDYNNLSNIPAAQTDSSTVDSIVLSIVDSNYVQARETPQDFAYGSLTGTPTIPTNNSQLTNGAAYVTQAAVDSAITALIDGAPGALDTLNELAAALGDDAAFESTITNSLATKLNLSGGTLTGTLVSQSIEPTTDDTYDLGSTTKRFRDLYLGPGSLYVNNKKVIEDESGTITVKTDSDQNLSIKTQGTGQTTVQSGAGVNITSTGSADIALTTNTGNIEMNGDVIINSTNSINSSNSDPINFGDNLDLNSNKIINVGTPTAVTDAVNKTYVDNLNVSTFTNDAGYVTNAVDSANVTAMIDATYVQARQDKAYSSLTGAPTNVSDFTNDAGYLTAATAGGLDSGHVSSIITDDVDKAFVDALNPDADTLDGQNGTYYLDYNNFSNKPTIPSDTTDLTNGAGYISANSTDTLTNKSGNVSMFTNDAGYLTSVDAALDSAEVTAMVDSAYVQARQTNTTSLAFSAITSTPTTLAGYGITDGGGTDSASVSAIITADVDATFINNLTIDADTLGGQNSAYHLDYNNFTNKPTIPTNNNQLTNGAGYITSFTETNDLSSAVTWANVPDANITESSVTQHQAALSITQSQISDLSAGTDSAAVTAMIDSNYVQARQANASPGATTISTYTFTATAGQTVFSVNYPVGKLNVYLNGILLDPTDYTATNGTSVTLDTGAAVNDLVNVITYTTAAVGTLDSAAVTGLIDSSYIQVRQAVQQDHVSKVVYDNSNPGSSVVLNAGSSAGTATYYGDVIDGSSNVILDVSGGTFTGNVMGEVHGDVRTADGSTIIVDVDNGTGTAVFTGNVTGTVSSISNHLTAIESMIDSNVNAVIDGAPGALDTLNELAAALGDDANFATTITNQIAALPDSSQVSGIITADVDAAYVQARQGGNVSTFTNDAGYLTAATAGGLDSALVSGIITDDVDKAFVDALNVDADTLDGQDGTYYLNYNNFSNTPTIPTNNNQLTNGAGYITSVPAQSFASLTGKPTTIAGYGITDAFDGVFASLTSKPTTLAGYGITDGGGTDSASVISLIDSSYVQARQSAVTGGATTVNTTSFTATAGQTTFSVNYTVGKLNVYLNGILLDAADFTATNGTSIVLATGADVGDILHVITYDTVAASTIDSAGISSIITADVDASFVNALGISAGVDSAGISSIITADVDATFINNLTIDADTLGGQNSAYHLDYTNFTNTPTIPTNNNQLTNGAGYLTSYTETNDLSSAVTWADIPDANVPQSAVTQHQAALTITESQISDLAHTTSLAFSAITSTPTTLAGYGITDGGGTDSAAVVSMIDSAYVQNRQSTVSSGATTIDTSTFTATAGQTVFTVNYTVGKLNVYLNGILLDPSDYTATNGTSITLDTGAAVNDLVNVITYTTAAVGNLDSAGVTGVVNSAYIQARQGGNVSQFTNDAGYLTSAIDSAYVTTQIDSLIDAAPGALNTLNELAAAIGDDANFSTTITNQIAALPDSSQVSGIVTADVDKAFVDALGINATQLNSQAASYYLDYNNFSNTPTIPTNNNQLTNGAGYLTSVPAQSFASLTGKPTTLAGYGITDGGGTDSASVSAIITADVDAAFVNGLGISSGTDSASIIAMIDSSYVQARQLVNDPGVSRLSRSVFTFTATANQTVFTGTATSGGTLAFNTEVDVYINGILLDATDYTLSGGNTLTLTSGTGVNNIVTIVDYGATAISLLDSAAITDIVDSAYVTARAGAGTDSATVSAIITADVDATFINNLTIDADTLGGQNSAYHLDYTNFTNTPTIPTNNNQLTNGAGYLTSFTETNDLSSAVTWANVPNANITESSVTQHQAALSITESQISDLQSYLTSVPAQTFASLTGKPTTIAGYGITDAFDGAYGSLTGAPTIPSLGNDFVDSAYVTTQVNAVIDAAPGALDTLNELAAALGDDANFSTTITNQIAGKLDSAQAIATITGSDLDMGGNKVLFGNVYTAQSDLPSASSYHGMFAHVHNDGAGYFAHAGNWVRLANQSEIPSVIDSAGISSIITADVDASFINGLGIAGYADANVDTHLNQSSASSNEVLSWNGSDYAWVAQSSGGGTDSATVSSIITADVDAAFVTNLGFTVGASGTTSNGIDTTYVYTATANQTAFTGSDNNSATLSYAAYSVMVYLNGILLVPTTDYTATDGSTVTLASGAALNDEVMIVTVKSGPKTWTEESGNYTATAGDKLFIDVSGGTATVTMPTSPTMGDEVRVIDATGNAATNNITINRNGNNINGAADNLVLDVNRAAIGLAYYNSTQGWVLIER